MLWRFNIDDELDPPEINEPRSKLITEIFGFTGIVFNGIPGLTEYFSNPKSIFVIKTFGFNEFLGLTE